MFMVKFMKINKMLFILGIIPFIIPILLSIYTISVQTNFNFFEYIFLYSFIYWPTYILGIISIIISFIIKKSR